MENRICGKRIIDKSNWFTGHQKWLCGKPAIGIDNNNQFLCSKHMRKYMKKSKFGVFEKCKLFRNNKRLII